MNSKSFLLGLGSYYIATVEQYRDVVDMLDHVLPLAITSAIVNTGKIKMPVYYNLNEVYAVYLDNQYVDPLNNYSANKELLLMMEEAHLYHVVLNFVSSCIDEFYTHRPNNILNFTTHILNNSTCIVSCTVLRD